MRREDEEVVEDDAVEDASSPAVLLLPLPALEFPDVLLIVELNRGPTVSPLP